jgi:hypothetical protein
MPKWEYITEKIHWKDAGDLLNAFGKAGWELVSAFFYSNDSPDVMVILKRPKEAQDVKTVDDST